MKEDDTNNMWEKMATYTRKVASETCGATKEGGETKLKILDAGTRKYKGLLWRRKNALDI